MSFTQNTGNLWTSSWILDACYLTLSLIIKSKVEEVYVETMNILNSLNAACATMRLEAEGSKDIFVEWLNRNEEKWNAETIQCTG